MQTLTFTNSRGTLVFGHTAPYWLQTVTGISGLGVSIEFQKSPYQDGETELNEQYNKRNITMAVLIKADDLDTLNAYKMEIQRVFARGVTSTLKYNNDTYEKECEVIVETAPRFSQEQNEKSECYQSFFVSLIAPNPFWLDLDFSGNVMAFDIPSFHFELVLTDSWVMQQEGTNRTTITNEGHVTTPVEITFNGPAINPTITNETTGEYISVTKTLLIGQKLIINTEFGNIRVQFDDGAGSITNAFGLIDNINSIFWQLEIGENEIVYTASAGVDTASVEIKYKNRFIGL